MNASPTCCNLGAAETPHVHQDESADHDHHDHASQVNAGSERRVLWVMILTGAFMVVEVVGGLLSGSLALLADAGHMLTDSAALALAWFAFRVGRKEADPKRTYGYHRFQILAAFVNGIALFVIAAWIVAEAVERLISPVAVMGMEMLVIASVGLLVNIVAFAILHGGERENLNIQGALLHVLGDLLGSAAAIVAAGVIMGTGWMPIDPILSVVVAILILRSAWKIVRRSGHILLEGTPDDLDPAVIEEALKASIPEIRDVHHVHAWSLTSERPLVTLHATVDAATDQGAILRAIQAELSRRFGVHHATVQIET
ncbi:MAG: cation diffusion facilitator family transporter [Rhodospirillales bacterium]|nr:cation diffusion facilitator family transporter [Rhodospirillales bacterium]